MECSKIYFIVKCRTGHSEKIGFEIVCSVTFRVCDTVKAVSEKDETLCYILKFNFSRTAMVSGKSFGTSKYESLC